MSNSTTNRERDQLIELTPTQQNPGAAKPTDFVIEDRDGGQRDAALQTQPIPDRNQVPR